MKPTNNETNDDAHCCLLFAKDSGRFSPPPPLPKTCNRKQATAMIPKQSFRFSQAFLLLVVLVSWLAPGSRSSGMAAAAFSCCSNTYHHSSHWQSQQRQHRRPESLTFLDASPLEDETQENLESSSPTTTASSSSSSSSSTLPSLKSESLSSASSQPSSEPAPKANKVVPCPDCDLCDGSGRIAGGIGAILPWIPIKAYRPCPNLVARGGTYQRSGQGLDEIAFGRDSTFKK